MRENEYVGFADMYLQKCEHESKRGRNKNGVPDKSGNKVIKAWRRIFSL